MIEKIENFLFKLALTMPIFVGINLCFLFFGKYNAKILFLFLILFFCLDILIILIFMRILKLKKNRKFKSKKIIMQIY
jgi:hypothetical protein